MGFQISVFIPALLCIVFSVAVSGFLLPETSIRSSSDSQSLQKVSFLSLSSSINNAAADDDDNHDGENDVPSYSAPEIPSFELDPSSNLAQDLMTTKLGLSEGQQQKLVDYCDLIVEWNDKINLISRKDCRREVVFGRHILPCLAPILLAPSSSSSPDFQIQPGNKVADIGTGGGLPGIPLAICYPEANFLLIDSVGKKLKAVDDMIERLGLKNAYTQHNRAEHVVSDGGQAASQCFDWCVGRSVASLPTFCSWMHHLLKPSTGKLLYIIGGNVPESSSAECDESIHDLLQLASDGDELVSEKRLLVFGQKSVLDMARASDNFRTAKQQQKLGSSNGKSKKNNNNARNNKPKGKPKGAWAKNRDQPKQRGYDDFQRFSSN